MTTTPNIYGPYNRPTEPSGSLAAPNRGNPSLTDKITEDFPGRIFRVECSGLEVFIKFDEPALTNQEQITLAASVSAWNTEDPKKLLLWSLTSEAGRNHKEVDYKTGLSSRLHKKISNIFRGEVRQVRYYADETEAQLVLQVDIAYTRAANGLAISRMTTRTWYHTDGTPHPDQKITFKSYDILHQMQEGVKRRQNVINILTINVLNMLITDWIINNAINPMNPTAQEIADATESAETNGAIFTKTYQPETSNYIQTGDLKWTGTPGISSDSTIWLNINVSGYGWTGPTIRDEILSALVSINT